MFNCDASLTPLAPFECPSVDYAVAPPLQSPNKYCYIGRYKSFTHQSNEIKSNSRHAKAGRNFRDTIFCLYWLSHAEEDTILIPITRKKKLVLTIHYSVLKNTQTKL